MQLVTWTVLLALAICVHGSCCDEARGELDLMMPGISPKQNDIYLCHGVALNTDMTIYITGIVPHVNSEIVHHMGIAGCDKPGSNEDKWMCNDYIAKDPPLCPAVDMPIYIWAKDAAELKLPDGVGFKIHYYNLDTVFNGGVDHSGVRVKFTFEPLPHTAAIMILGTDAGVVQPGQEEHFETACSIDDDIVNVLTGEPEMKPVEGRVTSGYRVRGNEWTEIGRRSPQLPHAFVPAKPVPLTKGDVVAVRCTLFNYKNHTVQIGPAHEDEMCLFDILYYADEQKTFSDQACLSQGPPNYYWKHDKKLGVSKVLADASVIPPPPNGPDSQQPKQLHHGRRGQFEQKKRETLLTVLRRMRVLP